MNEVRINLNEVVKVKLTDLGKDIRADALLCAEHIKGDFWCKDGKVKGCQTCKHDREWADRCTYCKRNKDDVGELTEWEPKEEA